MVLTLLPLFTRLLRLIPVEAVRSGPYLKVLVRADCLQTVLLSACADSNRRICAEKA